MDSIKLGDRNHIKFLDALQYSGTAHTYISSGGMVFLFSWWARGGGGGRRAGMGLGVSGNYS